VAAKSISDLETFWGYLEDVNQQNNQGTPPNWQTVAQTLRNLIDDRTALYAACVAVSAVEGEAGSKAVSDAAITASDLLITS